MKLSNPVHPSELILEYYLNSPSYVVSSGKEEVLKNIILNKISITDSIANILCNVFQTSKEYWMNLQKQWDEANAILESNEPCPDVSVKFTGYLKGPLAQAHEEGRPVKENIYDDVSVYILSEQAYKYMLSKCTKDEMWDLGFLGQSEKHVIKSQIVLPFIK